jgi:hypothetical protein
VPLASYMKQDPVLPQVKTVFLENRNNNHLIEKSAGRTGNLILRSRLPRSQMDST